MADEPLMARHRAAPDIGEKRAGKYGVPALVLFLLTLLFGLPWLSARVGGYTVMHGPFYPAWVPNVAVLGTALSHVALALGGVGLLCALVWRSSASWGGRAAPGWVLLTYAGLLVSGVVVRLETTVLTRMVHARDDQRVRQLYEAVRSGMTVAELAKLAQTFSQDIRPQYIRFPDARYAMLEPPPGATACGVEFSVPGRFSGTRMIAEVTACGVAPDASVLRAHLIDHKRQVAETEGRFDSSRPYR
ncbi:hypothetical protein ATSB10_34590 [Dyella thiooxydans]|uniref:Uncharacterized protein n=1 Tax=Dyella thiooxydans TaxID=445710 RepID=A0A160N4E7_9GAMM|nr:hypothetical protein [Dyella thiooxydans]AND70913.1 hypothetical protein ATSB10_34590 [Dyella thiooxydans]